jgi:hypothetical protein
MIRAVAFCPHPPLLVPEVAQGAAGELDEVRSACRAAIGRVAVPGRRVVVLGGGPEWAEYPANTRGSLAGYGVPVEVPLGSDEPGPVRLPLSLTIGAWLLRDALGPGCGAAGFAVGPQDGMPLAARAALDAGECALLVMGDGSARRSTSAPGYLDERAGVFDAGVAQALRSGEGERLHVDIALADELLVAGARAWDAAAALTEAVEWDADLLYDAAPYGVGYFVASWVRRG